MYVYRALPWFICLLVLAAMSESALAWQGSGLRVNSSKTHSFVVAVEGRKGTRIYVPDDYGAAPKSEDGADVSTKAAETQEQRLHACMETWDTKTHITKDHWRKICERMLSE